jgi:hypothetical protein
MNDEIEKKMSLRKNKQTGKYPKHEVVSKIHNLLNYTTRLNQQTQFNFER